MKAAGLPARWPDWRHAALPVAGLALWIAAGLSARRLRALEEARGIAPGRRAGAEAVASALGGFRGLVADFLWLRGMQLQDEGRFDELTFLYKLILDLQPRFTSVWAYHSWNFAYNLAYEAATPEERWHWIRTGLDLLEQDGIDRNPNSYQLHYELGYTYFFRVSERGGDPFYRYYQERLAPVPSWCLDHFDFVDAGLWSDAGLRYRLYRKRFEAGVATLGGATAVGGHETRARRMYVVAVNPPGALARAALRQAQGGLRRAQSSRVPSTSRGAEIGGDRQAPITPVPATEGAPLYSDAPDRLERFALHRLPRTPVRESSMPTELAGAVLLPLPDTDRTRTDEVYLTLELSTPADVWVGWVPDETRGFLVARRWLIEAESKPDCPTLMPSRLRVWALVEAGEWERAYEEFVQLYETRLTGDDAIESALLNFLRNSVYTRWREGRREEAASWHRRLRANFPSWRMSLEETISRMEKQGR